MPAGKGELTKVRFEQWLNRLWRTTYPLIIRSIEVTPIALPDPPLLAASGCHGPYFLRNIIQLETDAGIVGVGEAPGGEALTTALVQARQELVGRDAFTVQRWGRSLRSMSPRCYAGLEMACLDACGKALGVGVSELLGGPHRQNVEFSAYLFFRYAGDDSRLRADPRIGNARRWNRYAMDQWGEVRTPEAMNQMAQELQKIWGFRTFKLKAGVLPPDIELETLRLLHRRLGDGKNLRIDPNGSWTKETAVRIGTQLTELPIEYYEDPVRGRQAMASVRRTTQLPMATNACIRCFADIVRALRTRPIDVLLYDLYTWGGIAAISRLSRICRAIGWGLGQHSNSHAGITMAAMVHAGAIARHLTHPGDTHYIWLAEDADIIQGSKLAIRDGRIQLPKGPGLGVEVDEDKLARAHETYENCDMRRRDDAFTMRLMDPTWERQLV